MAFIVEDGTGLENATSYGAVDAATAYFQDDGRLAAWTAATSQILGATTALLTGGDPAVNATLLSALDWGGDVLDVGPGEVLRISGDDADGDPIAPVDLEIEDATVADLRAAILTFKGGGSLTLVEGVLRYTEVAGVSSGTLDLLLVDTEVTGTTTGHIAFVELIPGEASGETTQQQALIAATRYIDREAGPSFKGARNSFDQALQWPRTGARDNRGVAIDDDVIPIMLRQATYEAALVFRGDTSLIGAAPVRQVATRERDKIGTIEQETTYQVAEDWDLLPLAPLAARLLAELCDMGAAVAVGEVFV